MENESVMPPSTRKKGELTNYVLTFMIILYVISLTSLSYLKYKTFHTYWALDLASYNQLFWGTLRGHPAITTYNICHFGDGHFGLLWLLMSFIYLIFPYVGTSLFLASFAMGLGAIPVYLVAKKRMESQLAGLVFAAVYLTYHVLLNINIDDFSMEKFAIPLLLFAFYYLEENNFFKYMLFVFLSIFVRENVAGIIIMFGLFAAYRRRGLRWIATPIILGVVWLLISYYALDKYILYYGFDVHSFLFFDNLKIKPLLSHLLDGQLLRFIQQTDVISKVKQLFQGPYALSLLSPQILLLAAPDFLKTMLLKNPYDTFVHGVYYYSLIVPFVVLALVYSLSNILALLNRIKLFGTHFSKIKTLLLLLLFAVTVYHNYADIKAHKSFDKENFIMDEDGKIAWSMLEKIPDNASASVDWRFVVPMSTREKVYVFGKDPSSDASVEYILANYRSPRDTPYVGGHENIRHFINDSSRWEIVERKDDYVLLKKI